MSEYLSNYVIDPITRQARRFSQISQEHLNESIVLAESFSRWTPGRLWSASPPAEDDDEDEEAVNDTSLGIGSQWAGFWRSQAGLMPSPPLDSMPDGLAEEAETAQDPTPFPPLDTQTTIVPSVEHIRAQPHRTDSEQSLNPFRDLSELSRMHEEGVPRGHSTSDPLSQSSDGLRVAVDGADRPRDGSGTLPEDDGMARVRDRIKAIWREEGSSSTKSKKVHSLMMERYNASQSHIDQPSGLRSPDAMEIGNGTLTPPPSSPGAIAAQMATSPRSDHTVPESFTLLPSDIEPTYAPRRIPELKDDMEGSMEEEPLRMGCKHYVRSVKPQCVTCRRFYPCRLCHDEAVTDHVLPRHSTENMLCMHCLTPQPAAQYCKQCGECAGTYYCEVCILWNSDPEKSIYHCDDCGICRLGQGLGKDFYHCPVCAVCISINVAQTHRCIERSTKCDCPICGDYMFTSPDTVVFMRCGHSIHETCFKDWCRTAYKCPICSRSVVNMETQFRRLDRHIASQPMPDEYRDSKALVHCNDCLLKSVVPFHWLGLKCENCEGYNTTLREFIGGPDANNEDPPEPHDLTPQGDVAGEALASAMAQRAAVIAGTQRPTTSETRPATAISDAAPSATSPWLVPHAHGPRSASPVSVSNYFGIERRDDGRSSAVSTSQEDEHEHWGGQSPISLGGILRRRRANESESDDSDEDMEDEEEELEEEEDDQADEMALFGHR